VRQRVVWVRPGQTQWGAVWVGRYGRTKSHEPGEEEHVSFANHDLLRNGLPTLERENQSLVVTIANEAEAIRVLRVVRYHGFEFAD
jgi:hypothetical protein